MRALAWLLDAPDLLDAAAPVWQGKIAVLQTDGNLEHWLGALDAAPEPLVDFLALRPFERLGRYAEKLLAFYFKQQGTLVAYGLQVRSAQHHTVGEFDYLLHDGAALAHLEFATKLYLLEERSEGSCFIGPNLADSLQEKMRKILDRQLALGQHPAAQSCLPQPIAHARALIKGWLFYHGSDQPSASLGLRSDHCRGWWCALDEITRCEGERFVLRPRLGWLAPVQTTTAQTRSRTEAFDLLHQHFALDAMPLMVAVLATDGDTARETSRGFVVPNDWRDRAGQRAQRSFIAAS